MTLALVGHTGIAGLAEEVTYGSAVNATHWLPFVSESVEVDAPPVPVPLLFTGQTAFHNGRRARVLRHDVGGDINTIGYFDYKPFLLLLKHAFGSVATTGVGPFTHTFQLARQGVVGLTTEIYHGVHPTLAERAQVVPGCKVNQFEMTWESGGYATVRASLIGKKGESLTSVSSTPSGPGAEEEIAGHQAGTLTLGGTQHQLTRFGIRVDNKYARRPYLGSLYTDEPQPSEMAECMVFGRCEWVANQLYEDFLAATQQNGSIVVTGSGNNLMTITLDNVMLASVSKNVQGFGVVAFEFEGRCYADGSDRGIKIAMRNDNAAAI